MGSLYYRQSFMINSGNILSMRFYVDARSGQNTRMSTNTYILQN